MRHLILSNDNRIYNFHPAGPDLKEREKNIFCGFPPNGAAGNPSPVADKSCALYLSAAMPHISTRLATNATFLNAGKKSIFVRDLTISTIRMLCPEISHTVFVSSQ